MSKREHWNSGDIVMVYKHQLQTNGGEKSLGIVRGPSIYEWHWRVTLVDDHSVTYTTQPEINIRAFLVGVVWVG